MPLAAYNVKYMIIDSLSNAKKYFSLHKHFAKAFEYIGQQDLTTMEPGKNQVDGDEITAAVMNKEGVKVADAKMEAHNKYIDIQVLGVGQEQMGWKPREHCVSPKAEYNPDKDIIFYNDQPDTYFTLQPGQFAIFYPEDVHAPMIGEGPIRKLVMKVKL